jgi:hypothetical protein
MSTVQRAPLGWVPSVGLVALAAVGAYFGSHADVGKCENEPGGSLGHSVCTSLGNYTHKGSLLWILLVGPPLVTLLLARMLPGPRARVWIIAVWAAVFAAIALIRSVIVGSG